MVFTRPLMLVALAAVAIPLAIHLLGRRRARKVVLPTTRFAEGAHQASRGRQWLRRVVLLGLRVAAVVLVVLALAEPRLGGAGGDRDGRTWIICLDTSPSMLARDGDATRLDCARQVVRDFLSGLRPDARVALASCGRDVIRAAPPKAVHALEAESPAVPSDEPLGAILSRAVAAVPGGAGGSRVLIVTDATGAAARDMAPGRFKDLAGDVTIVPIGAPIPNGRLGLPKAVVTGSGRARSLSVEVGAVPSGNEVEVHLRLAGGAQRPPCRIGPGPGVARFSVPLEGDGPWQGKVWTAPDAMPLDDERFFTVSARTPVRMLVVDAATAEEDRPRSADFVAAAFAADEPDAPKAVSRIAAAKADAAALNGADVAFWVGPALPQGPDALARFLDRGGAVIWIPAEPAPPTADLLRLLAVEIGPASSPPDGVTLDPGGYASPLLGAFEGGSGGDLRKPVLKQRLTVKARATAEVIRFMDGEAAIVSQAAGKGRALVLAFGPGRAWGDLATRPEFVVLMHSLVESVAARDGPDEANVTVGRGPGWRRPDNRRPPGNYPSRPAETAVAGRQGPFSVNLCPDETADLAPRPDRLTQAFAPQRVRIASPADLAPASLAKTPSADAEGWFILPFALAVALEGLVAGRLSRPVSATPEPLARA